MAKWITLATCTVSSSLITVVTNHDQCCCDGLLIIMIYIAYHYDLYITVNEFHRVFHIWLFL